MASRLKLCRDWHRALEGGMRAVLDLDPFAAAPGAIAAIASLGDDPLKPHDTRLSEDDLAVRIRDMLRQADAVFPSSFGTRAMLTAIRPASGISHACLVLRWHLRLHRLRFGRPAQE